MRWDAMTHPWAGWGAPLLSLPPLWDPIPIVLVVSALGLVGFLVWRSRRGSSTTPSPPTPNPSPSPRSPDDFWSSIAEGRAPRIDPLSGVEIDVPTRSADTLLLRLTRSGWRVEDTGRTITTDDGEDSMTTLRILSSPWGEERGTPHPPLRTLRGVLHSEGDLVVGEGVHVDGGLSSQRSIVLSPGTSVSGPIFAGGDVRVGRGVVVGDVRSGGVVRIEKGGAVVGALVAVEVQEEKEGEVSPPESLLSPESSRAP